jgi:hypothetical protein
MSNAMSSQQILDREFLEIRCKILELAASFDRLVRADESTGSLHGDARMDRIRAGLGVLLDDSVTGQDRAEQVQLIFSREYDPSWRDQFGLAPVRKAK